MTPAEKLSGELRARAAAVRTPIASQEDQAYADLCESMATLLTTPPLPALPPAWGPQPLPPSAYTFVWTGTTKPDPDMLVRALQAEAAWKGAT